MNGVLIERTLPCEDEGRDSDYAVTSQGTPYLPLEASEGAWPCLYLDYGRLASRSVKE